MRLTIDVAVVKTNKYASRESGDTVEIVERPGGGISVIMADGQGSGRAAKTLSLLVTAKVSALLKEGVRDGASARAANDFLFAMRNGQVSATLDILSVDLKTETVVITRNSDTACYVRTADGSEVSAGAERPLGIYPRTRPWAAEIPVGPGVRVILVSDGVTNSGRRAGLPPFDLKAISENARPQACAADIADLVLGEAIARDGYRPADDMSVVALTLPEHDQTTLVRRMGVQVPLP
ncbi:MAG TPA: PP2C family protein-serine/threonine phosphatase [Thermomicrobiales bacterium]|nr:PP2C family protein-serine/threonine phosphatase [Thermomicrobiales bacterium]